MDTIIRGASVLDAEALCGIYAYYVERTAVSFEYEAPNAEEFAGRIARTLERYPYLVAVSEGEAVGYAYASAFKSRPAYDWAVETTVYVRRDARRLGVGRALYSALEEALVSQGVLNANACIAYAETPDEYLTQDSVRFHERLGYRMAAHFTSCAYKHGRWYDMVWMEKRLAAHPPVPTPITPYCQTAPNVLK